MEPAADVAARTDRGRVPTGAFVLAVVAAILLGIVMLFFVVRTPASGPRFAVGNAVGTACPAGEGIPVCFSVTVTNTGREAGPVRCDVIAAEGNTAAFAEGGDRFVSDGNVRPGEPVHLTVAVTTQTDTVLTPSVGCDPA
jgi:hypothetical protein